MKVLRAVRLALFELTVASSPVFPQSANELLARLISEDDARRGTARVAILRSHDRSLIPALVDALFFAPTVARTDVVACLEGLSGKKLGPHHRYWVEWVGGHGEIHPHDGYRAWKSSLFSRIDLAFGSFLDPGRPLAIRAEEIVWGGVKKDGLPALKSPRAVPLREARSFSDSEVVFGVGFGGQFRAYPQRILDWHEMVNDVVGGQPFVISYCTLCGSAVAYGTRFPDGRVLAFGSSGLLYRSNKLMYDEQTLSLWSNLTGEAVAGPLFSSRARLPMLALTVTSWREWRSLHPETTILSLETGYRRDYSVGAAYGRYFASPDTMFPVWMRDDRLEAKAWVYALRSGAKARAYPLELLALERVVNDALGAVPIVLVADPESGSVRAYYRGSHEFTEGPAGFLAEPSTGAAWKIGEDALVPQSSPAAPLPRFPGHRAYWFGWYAFFPETSLYEGCVGDDLRSQQRRKY
jgi:hypothetical protein